MEAMLSSAPGIIGQWASVFWATMRETAPFLVLGLMLAGMLHVLVPPSLILWALGQQGWRGAVRGAIIGMPLPLCSCGVLPTALTLRRQGASLSAATSFTISTPETSIDALAITAALLPLGFMGVRPIAALVLAVSVGILVEYFSRNTKEELRDNVNKLSQLLETPQSACEDKECCDENEICRVCGLMQTTSDPHSHGPAAKLRGVFTYAFGTFFRDIANWLLLGLVAAALVQVLVPAEGLQTSWIGRYPVVQILIAIMIGIPLYSCATATTPLVAVLLSKGIDPGAALALLLAGPATNIGNVFALKRELGGRTTFVYYASLFVMCFVLGLALHWLWPMFKKFPMLTEVMSSSGAATSWVNHLPGWLEISSAWLLVALILLSWGRGFFERSAAHGHHAHHEHDGHAH